MNHRQPKPRRGRDPRRPAVAVLVLAVCLCAPAVAQETDAESHADGTPGFSDRLTLQEVAAQARERHPEQGLGAARAARARAERDYADHWFPGTTELAAFRVTDQPLDDTGFYEDEVALSLPLWLPGERRTQDLLAGATRDVSESADAAFAWRVSGEVRRALWGVLRTQREWDLARQQQARLAEVLAQAVILQEAGDIALGDRLAVQQELAAWRADTLALEAEFQDALRMYRALTGLDDLPAGYLETRSTADHVGPDHPALRLAQDQYERAAAALAALEESNPVRPALQLYWRGTRPDRPSPRLDALGLGFSLPLGTAPSRAPELAARNEGVAEAEAGFLALRRELELALHEAEHQLHTVERQLENSRELMDAAAQRRDLDQLSLELGEISMQEWLRRLQSYREIQRTHERLLLQRGAAIAAYNQAVGESL